jgi:hypothetical protein
MTKLRRMDFIGFYTDQRDSACVFNGEYFPYFYDGHVMFDLQSSDGFFKTERVPLTQEENIAITRVVLAARERMMKDYE